MNIIERANKELKIVYLDDRPPELDSFFDKVNRYNMGLDTDDSFKMRLVKTFYDSSELISFFERNSEQIDVFISDHNMPDKLGLDVILYLKSEYKSIIYVLYSAASNLTEDIRKKCKENNIIHFQKSESYSTLFGQIVNKYLKNSNSPMDLLYFRIANDIIEAMGKIEKFDSSFRIHIGKKVLTPSQLIQELNNRSKLGFDYIESYYEGLKFFKNR